MDRDYETQKKLEYRRQNLHLIFREAYIQDIDGVLPEEVPVVHPKKYGKGYQETTSIRNKENLS